MQRQTIPLRVLVTGGAGYIGSHMVKLLGCHNCEVTTLDDLSSGHKELVGYGRFVQGNVGDRALLADVLSQPVDVVLHFAGHSQVAESVTHPDRYFNNNVVNTLHLLNVMMESGVKRMVFSSSAAVYGEPETEFIHENHPLVPVSPYGRSKLMIEQILADYDRAFGLKSVCLRYFNAAGADPETEIGEQHIRETHLIPLLLGNASGRLPPVRVFGRDYMTADGTCIRDYVHVSDVCSAHWLALQALMDGAESQVLNLGGGRGFSVQEVIDAARRVTGRSIEVLDADRRNGDPARLVADTTRVCRTLAWRRQYSDLEIMIEHAWQWEIRRCQR